MKIIHSLIVLLLVVILSCSGSSNYTSKQFSDVLESGFVTPPDSIQTSIYWYWISDNISREGV